MNKLLITGFQFRDIIENSREFQMNQVSAEDLSLLSIDYDEGLYMLSLASARLNNQDDANEFVDVTAYFPSGMFFCGIIQSDFESIKEENRVRFNLTENTAVDIVTINKFIEEFRYEVDNRNKQFSITSFVGATHDSSDIAQENQS